MAFPGSNYNAAQQDSIDATRFRALRKEGLVVKTAFISGSALDDLADEIIMRQIEREVDEEEKRDGL